MNFGENFELSKSGQYYTKDKLSDFLTAVGKLKLVGKKLKYFNVPCSFDIETSSVMLGDIPAGIMYMWSFCLNGAVYIGRTYDEFLQLLDAIRNHYKIDMNRRLRIYVRNLGFEFQFIRHYFDWLTVFARQPRSPMSAVTTDGIEFRCSYFLTNQKLEVSAEELLHYKVNKLVGSLDYRLVRHWKSDLTEQEILYSIYDVLIDASLIYDKIESDGNIIKIPLTATGYTRKLCRNNCMPAGTKEFWQYSRQMAKLTMTKDEYVCALLAFAGGFVHASPLTAMQTLTDIKSMDFTSAYPSVMVCEKEFPMSKGYEIDPRKIQSREELLQLSKEFAFIGSFEFVGVSAKFDYDYYLSVSKVRKGVEIDAFNGRIVSADSFQCCLTHIDFQIMLQTYNIQKLKILRLWRYRKDYLPKAYICTVLEEYRRKTALKGVVGQEEAYMSGKRNVNSLYGMMVTQIDRPEVSYDQESGEWGIEEKELDDVIDRYNNDEHRFLSYLWGIMVTALCRRNIFSAIIECKDDYHYSDTDSVKISNYEQHKEYFEKYNADIDRKMKLAADHVGFDYELTRPKTIKGVPKPLGHWDDDGFYTQAKFLNAKRYIYVEDGELHVTIAGTGKVKTAKFLMDKYKTFDAVFEAFDDGLQIAGEYTCEDGEEAGTGKLTHIYNDYEVNAELTDYNGITAPVHEMSSVYLTPCEYSLGFAESFLSYIRNVTKGLRTTKSIPI